MRIHGDVLPKWLLFGVFSIHTSAKAPRSWTGAGRAAHSGCWHCGRLFRPGCAYRAVLLRNIREQIARQCVQEPKAYYVDWPELVSRRLDERNYYLADDGFVLYYPRRALGPSITGIPSFRALRRFWQRPRSRTVAGSCGVDKRNVPWYNSPEPPVGSSSQGVAVCSQAGTQVRRAQRNEER